EQTRTSSTYTLSLHDALPICFKIGNGTYLKPPLLGGAVNLHIVGKRGGKAKISTTKFYNPEREWKFFQQRLHIDAHRFKNLIGYIWVNDLHDFHIVELVDAVQSADIGTVSAGLPAETGSIRGVFDGERFFRNDGIPVEVGNRYFGRGGQVQVVACYVIHLSFFIGQLPGSKTRLFIHQH